MCNNNFKLCCDLGDRQGGEGQRQNGHSSYFLLTCNTPKIKAVFMKIIIFVFLVVIQQVSYGDTPKGNIKELRLDPVSSVSTDNVKFRSFYFRSSGEKGSLDNNTVLNSGDCHRIEFTSNCQKCYVYILQYDQHNQVTMLFPPEVYYRNVPRNIGKNPVSIRKTYFVPGKDNNGMRYFCLDNNAGYETIHFIISKRKRSTLVAAYNRALENKPEMERLARLIRSEAEVSKGNRRYVTTKHDVITEVVKCKKSQGCVEKITFKHE